MFLSLVCGELSSILVKSADLHVRAVGNITTPVYDFSLYTTFGLLKEAKLDDWPLECSLFRLDFNGANVAIISWECLDDLAKIPSATGWVLLNHQYQVSNLNISLRSSSPLLPLGKCGHVFTKPSSPEMVGEHLGLSPPLSGTQISLIKDIRRHVRAISSNQEMVRSDCFKVLRINTDVS